MTMDWIQVGLVYIAIPILIGLGRFLMQSLLNRLSILEHQIDIKVDEPRVRQLLSDKIDPLQEDIAELKVRLDKIIDLLLKIDK
jgi:hypothetical protein